MQKARAVRVISRDNMGRGTTMFLILNAASIHSQSEQSFEEQLMTFKKLMMKVSAQSMELLAAVYC